MGGSNKKKEGALAIYRKSLNLGGRGGGVDDYSAQGGGRIVLWTLPWKSLSKIQHWSKNGGKSPNENKKLKEK